MYAICQMCVMNKMEFEDHLYTKVLNFVKLENDSAVIKELEAIARTDVTMKIRVNFDLNKLSVTERQMLLN